jgi:hypothetical protein
MILFNYEIKADIRQEFDRFCNNYFIEIRNEWITDTGFLVYFETNSLIDMEILCDVKLHQI